MEIRWMWRIFTMVVLVTQGSFTQNMNKQKPIKTLNQEQTSDTSNFNKLGLTSSEIVNILVQNEEQEEFLDTKSNQPHSRKKRVLWVTEDGRLALPPGTTLSITPTIAMPLVRYPPEGFLSNITISLPVTIDFDKLGLTDNENPLGVLPPVFERSFGRTAGIMLGNYIANYLHYRMKRETSTGQDRKVENEHFKINVESKEKVIAPEMPAEYKHAFHGGERAILYGVVEDFMATFGMNGKACLLRTICEVHSRSLDHFGVFGEMIKLFLTATKSPFAHHIPEYVEAQRTGEGIEGAAECFPYYKDCPRGLFKVFQEHKYSENSAQEEFNDAQNMVEQSFNDIEKGVFDKKILKGTRPSGIKSM